MIFSENRFPLFGIMLWHPLGTAQAGNRMPLSEIML
jgi:hypothetical protein